MKKKFRIIIAAMLCICLTIGVTGCAALEDTINEIQGNLSKAFVEGKRSTDTIEGDK